MKVLRPKLLFTFAFTVSFASFENGNARQSLKRHWTETSLETLWTGRYNNCDYGYYVSLPKGVVGHATLPPSPNHGFLVALPDIGTMNYVSDQKERFIWVDASYNTNNAHSLSDLVVEPDSGETRASQMQMKMAGLSAVQARSAHHVSASNIVEVTTVALRGDIIYTVGMRTNDINAMWDEAEYKRIILGFKLLPLPREQCSNG